MLRKIRREFRWISIVKDYHSNDFDKFLVNIEYFEKLYPLDYYEKATKGTALIATGKTKSAEIEFSELIYQIKIPKSEKVMYILLYAKAMIEDIHGNRNAYLEIKSEADKLNCGILYQRMLPI